MSRNVANFDFATSYRELQPTAERAVVLAREAAHVKLRARAAQSAKDVVDLVQLAFGLPVAADGVLDWFEEAVKDEDPHFTLARDFWEGRIVATLILADLMTSGSGDLPALVLAGSFSGRRTTVTGSPLVAEAQGVLASLGRSRGLAFAGRLAVSGWQDLDHVVSAAETGDPTGIHAAIKAIAGEAEAREERLVAEFNGALDALATENRRLAEEVDLLWWHLGSRSYLLDRPLSEVDDRALPMIVGSDLATMINVLPGPHGALGILRQALGARAEERQTVLETLMAVPGGERGRILDGVPVTVTPIAALSFGLRLLEDSSVATAVPSIFEARTAVRVDAELTRFELAVQAFYERMFLKAGWL